MPKNKDLTPVLMDSLTRRENIRRKTLEGLEESFPLQTRNFSISIKNPRVEEKEYSSRQQKDALLAGKTLSERVRGDLIVKDAKGKTINEAKNFTLMQLPYFTPRHTFIVDGTEYNVANQIRTKPGVYTRRRGNEELEATFNLAKGSNFRVLMDPAKGHLSAQPTSSASRVPLYPVLRALGIPHKDIANHWGSTVAETNREAFKKPERHVEKFYRSFIHPFQQKHTTQEDKIRALHEYLDKTKMSPEVTKRTLGTAYDKASPLAILAASGKLLDVHRDAKDTDDRDSLEFKTFHSVDDFIKERLSLDARSIKAKLGLKLDAHRGDIRKALPPAPFTRSIHSFLVKSALSSVPMQINPMELMDSAVRITSLGEGAIASERAIPLEARNLHPTHFGVMDPVRTPECHDALTEVFTAEGWKPWPEVTYEDLLACRIKGRLEFHTPSNLIATPYQGPMYGVTTGKISYLVTPNHRLWSRPVDGNPSWRIYRADDVHGKPREFETAHNAYRGKDVATFQLPTVQGLPKNEYPDHGGHLVDNTINVDPIPMPLWASFMGWYLSEGCSVYDENTPTYHAVITQSREANPEKCDIIEALLRHLPFAWSYTGKAFVIGVKQLASYLSAFGLSDSKYIPSYFFDASIEVRENLLEALLLGDGRIGCKRATGKSYRQRVMCTTSPQLAIDVERLAISLGYPTRTARYIDKREERYLPVYEIRLLCKYRRQAFHQKGHYRIEQYDGLVYCAEVPGNLLYTRRGDYVPLWSGNSFKAGIDIRSAMTTRRDEEGNLYAMLRNVKTGRRVPLKAADLAKAIVAFPGEQIEKGRIVDVMRNGNVERIGAGHVTHQIDHASDLYSPTTNLLPLINGMQGNRALMASKQQSQALSLVNREAPLVQVRSWNPRTSVEQEMVSRIVPTAPIAGTIEKIDQDYIYLRPTTTKQGAADEDTFYKRGSYEEDDEFYTDFLKLADSDGLLRLHYDTDFPLAAKSYLHNNLKVKAGDKVRAGQHLADSNYTKDGTLALGTNLSVAYMPYRGLNTNDGLVVSEGAAKRLVSEHMYKYIMQLDGDVTAKRDKHRAYFGSRYSAQQYGQLDDNGVVKKGTVVQPHDPLIVAVRENKATGNAVLLGRLSKSLVKPYIEEVEIWDHDRPGTIIDVVKTTRRITVTVKTEEVLGVGDKLSGRYGNKGVIAKIVPDHKMIQDEKGKPIDLLFTSAGVVSRINPAQIVEAALGKVADYTGKPVILDQFAPHDNVEHAKQLLKKHNLTDKETVFDPETQKKIPGVFVGKSYILKLFKTTDSNWAAHGAERYDFNQQPARGGADGAKALGKMEFDGLVAHNARNVLREAASIKGQRNDEFWRAVQLGLPTPAPQTNFAYNKFLTALEGAGIKVNKQGSRLALGPLTDQDITKMSAGVLRSPQKLLRAKDLKPETGGLFDPAVTGGTNGTKWSHVDLHEPIVNPVFAEPVRRLLSLTKREFTELHGKHGGAHFKRELKKINVDSKLKDLHTSTKTLRGTKLDDAVKQIKYLSALKEQNLRPQNAYVLSKIPVTPPIIRPVLPLKDGRLQIGDANLLYRDAFLANKQLGLVKSILPSDELRQPRNHLFEAIGAVFGTHAPVSPTSKKRGAKGYLNLISGTRPGSGFFQSKLMKRQQDISGRATIAPDPTLNMDEIGVPEDMLWGMYGKFIIARLVKKGYAATDAKKMVDEKQPIARNELLTETRERPVMVNRAPSLHRFNIVGAYPKIVSGKTIRLNPFAEKGLNADYDGDAIQIHAPVTPLGISDVKRMTLSNLIFSDRKPNYLNVAPDMEAVLGLHRATSSKNKNKKTRYFATREKALSAYHRGEIGLGDPIEVK